MAKRKKTKRPARKSRRSSRHGKSSLGAFKPGARLRVCVEDLTEPIREAVSNTFDTITVGEAKTLATQACQILDQN